MAVASCRSKLMASSMSAHSRFTTCTGVSPARSDAIAMNSGWIPLASVMARSSAKMSPSSLVRLLGGSRASDSPLASSLPSALSLRLARSFALASVRASTVPFIGCFRPFTFAV